MKSLKILILIFFTGLGMSCIDGKKDRIILSGTIEADVAHAGSRVGGRVKEVFVDEGEMVNKGDVIVRLETDALLAEKAKIEAALAEAEAAFSVVAAGAKAEDIEKARHEVEAYKQALKLAEKGPLPEEIEAAESQADALEAVYRNAKDAAERSERLFNEGIISERELIATAQAAESAKKQWEAAKKQVEVLKNSPREEEIAVAKAKYMAALQALKSIESGATKEQLESAKARVETVKRSLDRIEIDISETSIVAPCSGLMGKFDLKPGDFVAPGQAICSIVDMMNLEVKVYVPENRLGFVSEGKEVAVTVDSYPKEIFKGHIKNVSAEAEFTPRNVQTVEERVTQVFAVIIAVPNPDLRLRPGMAADVTISLKSAEN